LLERSGILPNEQVGVLNINNGARFTTYAIEAPRGSRMFGINGAGSAQLQAVRCAPDRAQRGDRLDHALSA
jgi:aspartate 1-decarboxylase